MNKALLLLPLIALAACESSEAVTSDTTVPATTAAPVTEVTTTLAKPESVTLPVPTVATVTVINVIDGDTVDLSTGERVRIIGIDTPEVGDCGADVAAARLTELVLNQPVVVTGGARDDVDRYGRILRYVDTSAGDAGRYLIGEGYAIARYDSRDGYGGHPREADYVALDEATPNYECAPPTTPAPVVTAAPRPVLTPAPTAAPAPVVTPAPAPSVSYANCDAVRAAGAAPIHIGDPGYSTKLDRDRDGIGCE